MVETTTSDLHARLETIDEKLQSLVDRTTSSSATPELQSILDEQSSTQKCLSICAQFSKLIEEVQSSSAKDDARGSDSIPKRITSDGIEECRISMEQTTARLESHMQAVLDRITSESNATMTHDDTRYLARLREEWITARKCRDICIQADQHLKEEISIIDNHATGDKAVQMLVSNSQKTIHGKNRGYGDHIKQLGGHLSDESIQKVSGDFLQMTLHVTEESAYSNHADASPEEDKKNQAAGRWRPEYGNGKTLRSRVLTDPTKEDDVSSQRGPGRTSNY